MAHGPDNMVGHVCATIWWLHRHDPPWLLDGATNWPDTRAGFRCQSSAAFPPWSVVSLADLVRCVMASDYQMLAWLSPTVTHLTLSSTPTHSECCRLAPCCRASAPPSGVAADKVERAGAWAVTLVGAPLSGHQVSAALTVAVPVGWSPLASTVVVVVVEVVGVEPAGGPGQDFPPQGAQAGAPPEEPALGVGPAPNPGAWGMWWSVSAGVAAQGAREAPTLLGVVRQSADWQGVWLAGAGTPWCVVGVVAVGVSGAQDGRQAAGWSAVWLAVDWLWAEAGLAVEEVLSHLEAGPGRGCYLQHRGVITVISKQQTLLLERLQAVFLW